MFHKLFGRSVNTQKETPKVETKAAPTITKSSRAPVPTQMTKAQLLTELRTNMTKTFSNEIDYQRAQEPLFLEAAKSGATFTELATHAMRDFAEKGATSTKTEDACFRSMMVKLNAECPSGRPARNYAEVCLVAVSTEWKTLQKAETPTKKTHKNYSNLFDQLTDHPQVQKPVSRAQESASTEQETLAPKSPSH